MAVKPIHDLAFMITICVVWIGPAVLTARLAARKGFSFGLYLVAALVSWPIALIVALVVRDRRTAV
jgi:hypothetical protein